MNAEETLTTVGIVLLILERCASQAAKAVNNYRRAKGANLRRAFMQAGSVLQDLHDLYVKLKDTNGFHSIRLLSAHNSGNDLSKTMLWKSSVLNTLPVNHDIADQWYEQPLDHEYLSRVLRPVVEEGQQHIRTTELAHNGPLGAAYSTQGVAQSFMFLIHKNDTEIVYAAVTFSRDSTLDPLQLDAIRVCRTTVTRRLA